MEPLAELDDVAVSLGPDAETVLHSVSFDVGVGETVALVGPSGSGKTTLLRVIAGLQRIDSGRVRLAGVEVDGATFVPPEKRGVGLVFQDGALFPHQSVAANVGFGLERSLSKGQREARVASLLELLGIDELAERRPDTLSGGQRQRVALARALAPEPRLLLMDEPFSALDTGLRARVRRDVAAVIAEVGIAAVFVTHDQHEALALGDRVGVLLDGTLAQLGSPAEVYHRPATAEVGEFLGEGTVMAATVIDANTVDTAIGPLPAHAEGLVPGAPARIMVRPQLFELAVDGSATVVAMEYYGAEARYEVRTDGGELVVVRMLRPRFSVGDTVALRRVGEPVAAWPVR